MFDVTNPTGLRWIARTDSVGGSYCLAERVEMPNIPAEWLDCVVFLYENKDAAQKGAPYGGTGYIASVTSEICTHLYIVTNAHAVERGAAVRVNLRGGGFAVLNIPPGNWYDHPAGDDVSVAPVVLENASYRLTAFPADWLLTDVAPLTVGDDCFFMGRHIWLDGKQRNTPSVRFGNISMLDAEPVWQKGRGFYQESIVVEARSLGGFSGSPVFTYRDNSFGVATGDGDQSALSAVPIHGGWVTLLGIDWGHMSAREALEAPGMDMPREDKDMALNSGMMLVVPGWKIREALNRQDLVRMREEAERKIQEADESAGAVMDSATADDRVSLKPLDPATALRALLNVKPESGDEA